MGLYPNPVLPDSEDLVYRKLTARFPDAYVGPEDQPDITLPALIYSTDSVGQQGNGPHLWSITVTVTVVGTPTDAWQYAKDLYTEVHSWAATTDDVGRIVSVTDISAPSRDGDGSDTKTDTQYTGMWTLLVRARPSN